MGEAVYPVFDHAARRGRAHASRQQRRLPETHGDAFTGDLLQSGQATGCILPQWRAHRRNAIRLGWTATPYARTSTCALSEKLDKEMIVAGILTDGLLRVARYWTTTAYET